MRGSGIRDPDAGFTITELLVYVALFGVVVSAFYSLFITNLKSYSSQENTIEMTQDLRGAMDVMVREIRMAGYDPLGAGGIGFVDDTKDKYDTDRNSIHFTMDFNKDGNTDGRNEDINYYLYTPKGGTQNLGRRTGPPGHRATAPLADNIADLTFTYTYADGQKSDDVDPPRDPSDADGDDTNDYDDIRSIGISITAQAPEKDPMSGRLRPQTLTSRVRLRNAGLD